MVRILLNFFPVSTSNAPSKLIRIVGGTAHHSEHLARARIQGHHSTLATIHREFSNRLQVKIEGQFQRLARNGFLHADQLALIPAVVYEYLPLPIDAH